MHNKTRFIAVLLISFIGIALVFAMSESPVVAWRIEDAAPESPAQELDVTKRANADYVRAGDQLTYTLAVTNTESFAVTATITDILPANVILGGASGTVTIILPPGWIVWSPVLLDPGEVWAETVVVTVTEGYAGPLTNTLQVTTEEGPGGTDMAVVTAEEGIAGLTADNDSPTYLGAPTTLTATIDAGSDVTYIWNFGDGEFGEGAVVTHSYLSTGSYPAIVTAINHVSSLRAATMVTITDVPITGLAAINDSPTWLGYATTLTATIATGSNVTYAWAFGDGGTGSGPIVSHEYPSVGTYTAVVTASNSLDAVNATSIVTITVAPVTGLTVVNDSPTLIGDPTTLTATVATGADVTYAWAFGDGETGSGPVVTHTYPSLGFYTAIVTATNEVNAISATSRVTITDGSITGLTARNSSPTQLGSATALTATVATGSNVIYAWDFGDGETGGGAAVSHVYPGVGTYTAVVTASNSLTTLSATSIVTITDVPVAGLTATNDGPTQLGQPTTFTAEVTAGSNVTYTWTFGDGGTAYGRVVSHVYSAGGTYTAIVRAENSVSDLTADTQVNVGAHIYLPLVLRNWSAGSVTPTPTTTPTITPTPSPQDVYVLPNHSHYTSGSTLYVVGEAQNDGDGYAVLVRVPVQLLDSSDHLLVTYYTYISLDLPAGEKSCFHLAINNPPASWASIHFDAPTYYSFANQPWPDLTIYNDNGEYQTDFTYKITGNVRNDESQSAETVLVEGALYNSADKIVGCRLSPAIDPSLAPGESSPFELFYGYDGDYSDVTTYRLQADSIP